MSRRALFTTLAIGVSSVLLAVSAWSWYRILNREGPALTGGADNAMLQERAAPATERLTARYVGRETCAACHAQENERWLGSHHDLAMQVAGDASVLGDFGGAEFHHSGVTSRFYRDGGRFMVHTDGPDGAMHDYRIRYTFGVDPLQQYLIEFPDGRLQALGIAWDTRAAEEGGQRWFHLYPDQILEHGDPLHWTGLLQNWNFMCAECHSTNLQRNYDQVKDRYDTTWSEIDVSCEACHGPGSNHVEWARSAEDGSRHTDDSGLLIVLDERSGVHWSIDEATGKPTRSEPRRSDREIEMCARCHSRRGPIWGEYVPGRPLLDTHLPQLLSTGMYYPDGQIQDEVYVYGSFLQSRMYAAGVTCSDCHDPHSLRLRVPGDGVCLQCHDAQRFATSAHHHHDPQSGGSACAGCHMPQRTYMIVDPRRDHSMRVPRPDLSVTLGTPNACNGCHRDRDAQWAATQVERWYGHPARGSLEFANALHAARTGEPDAEALLVQLAGESAAPAIVRATALAELHPYLSVRSLQTVVDGLYDENPLVREAALGALEGVSPEIRTRLVPPLLGDSVRAVRITAARQLADVPREALDEQQRAERARALDEYVRAQQSNADRPEAHLSLGVLYTALGEYDEAETAYRAALKLEPRFIAAYVNLADLYRLRRDEVAGERVLRAAIALEPGNADAHHALGLTLIRRKHMDEAIEALRRAAALAPDNARYAYVYAISLDSTGRRDEAIRLLEGALARHPGDVDIINALIAFNRQNGDEAAAQRYADRLRGIFSSGAVPGDD